MKIHVFEVMKYCVSDVLSTLSTYSTTPCALRRYKRGGDGETRLGRIPVASIKSVWAVPKSISDFIVQFTDEKGDLKDLYLQRIDLERDMWVKNLKALLVYARGLRRLTRDLSRSQTSRRALALAVPIQFSRWYLVL